MEIISYFIKIAFGFSFVIFLMGFMLYRNSARWRELASVYGQNWQKPVSQKGFQHGVLYGKNVAFNSYNGILTLGAHLDGVAIKVMAPFCLFSPPLFIPYEDIKGWKQSWYLNAKTIELQFERKPEFKMVMPREQIEWMQEISGSKVLVSKETPPHADKPIFWYGVTILLGALTLLLMGYLLISNIIMN